jgi:4-hydroxy-tetrahydrodipicolinate synthase
MPKGFLVFSGDDGSSLAYMQLGAHGVISVTANVAPRMVSELCEAALAGDFARAVQINNRLLPLNKQMFVETNPIPVKWALHRMGRIAEGIRLPLTPLAPAHHDTVAAALKSAGCIN